MRRFGEAIVPGQRYRERPGAYAVILDRADVLVTEQLAPRLEFQLPGGGIDPGEGQLTALHRECFEETGWRIRPIRRLGAFQRYAYMPEYDRWAHKVCHVWLAHPVARIGPPREVGHTAVWMPAPSALELLANDGDRHFLRRAIRGAA
ncbi:MAG: NUDIX hydrolase [Amaricoccus sp.]